MNNLIHTIESGKKCYGVEMAAVRSEMKSSSTTIIDSLGPAPTADQFCERVYTRTNFVITELIPALTRPARRVIALDADETVIDHSKSEATRKLVFINLEKLKAFIKYAYENDVLLMFVTARTYSEDPKDSFLSLDNIVKELGKHYFAYIFHTNGVDKSAALDCIWSNFYGSAPDKKSLICMVDDSKKMLKPCVANGYLGILADKTDKDAGYLDEMKNFVNGKPISKINFEEPAGSFKKLSGYLSEKKSAEFNGTKKRRI